MCEMAEMSISRSRRSRSLTLDKEHIQAAHKEESVFRRLKLSKSIIACLYQNA